MKRLIAIALLSLLLIVSCLPLQPSLTSSALNDAYWEGYHDGYNQGQKDMVPCPSYDIAMNYPTRAEVEAFLAQDDTDSIIFDWSCFVCTDYVERLNHNAWAAGIPCYTVWITWQGTAVSGHNIAAFPIHEGKQIILIFVDPQRDTIYEASDMQEGKEYPIGICPLENGGCQIPIIGKMRIDY
jgi:hypothetical protein